MGEGGWIASLDIRIAAGYYKVKLRIVEVSLSETERGMGTMESARCKAFVTAAVFCSTYLFFLRVVYIFYFYNI